jgi:hypothetical protein
VQQHRQLLAYNVDCSNVSGKHRDTAPKRWHAWRGPHDLERVGEKLETSSLMMCHMSPNGPLDLQKRFGIVRILTLGATVRRRFDGGAGADLAA